MHFTTDTINKFQSSATGSEMPQEFLMSALCQLLRTQRGDDTGLALEEGSVRAGDRPVNKRSAM